MEPASSPHSSGIIREGGITSLPIETLDYILKSLSPLSISRLSRTSRSFYSLTTAEYLYRSIQISSSVSASGDGAIDPNSETKGSEDSTKATALVAKLCRTLVRHPIIAEYVKSLHIEYRHFHTRHFPSYYNLVWRALYRCINLQHLNLHVVDSYYPILVLLPSLPLPHLRTFDADFREGSERLLSFLIADGRGRGELRILSLPFIDTLRTPPSLPPLPLPHTGFLPALEMYVGPALYVQTLIPYSRLTSCSLTSTTSRLVDYVENTNRLVSSLELVRGDGLRILILSGYWDRPFVQALAEKLPVLTILKLWGRVPREDHLCGPDALSNLLSLLGSILTSFKTLRQIDVQTTSCINPRCTFNSSALQISLYVQEARTLVERWGKLCTTLRKCALPGPTFWIKREDGKWMRDMSIVTTNLLC